MTASDAAASIRSAGVGLGVEGMCLSYQSALGWALPSAMAATVVLTMVVPIVRFRAAHPGVNPIAVSTADTPYDYVGRSMPVFMSLTAFHVGVYGFAPDSYWLASPILYLCDNPYLIRAGCALVLAGVALITVAQQQMGASWRVGIDAHNATALVAHGLYAYSRNPIYVGLGAVLLGLFCAAPNAVSFGVWLGAWFCMGVQARLEEQHLRALHGPAFDAYARQTPRWF